MKILNLKFVIMWKYLAKRYVLAWSEDFFVIKKVENTVPWTYVISDLYCEEIVGTFCEKELHKIRVYSWKN